MPRKENLNKVMVIGSGPIIIGQAAEFDYAGSQACRALKEDGLEVVLHLSQNLHPSQTGLGTVPFAKNGKRCSQFYLIS